MAVVIPEEFAIGDLVYLRSGSPKMTVISTSSIHGTATVIWCAFGSDKVQERSIPVVALRKAFKQEQT